MYLKSVFILFVVCLPFYLFALPEGTNVDYEDMLSKMPPRYDPIESKKIGEDKSIEREINKFRYTKLFFTFGLPTNHSVALTNMDSTFYFPPAIVENTTSTDLIKDQKLERISGFYLALEYRMFESKYIKGFRLSGSMQKQAARMSKVLDTSINLSVEDVDVPYDYATAYDFNAYNLVLNYDFFIFSRDWIVPYVGIGIGKQYYSMIGRSEYRKKTCEPVDPGTGGIPPEPNCPTAVSKTYDLSTGWNTLDVVGKVGVNILNGYIFIDYTKLIGKASRANTTTSQMNFGIRVPLY